MARANIKKQKAVSSAKKAVNVAMKRAMGHYILVGKKVKDVPLFEWGRWFEDSKDRFMFSTTVGRYRVSTVFLGLDYSFGGRKPILFETMVFRTAARPLGKAVDEYTNRYHTYKEAEQGHLATVKLVQAARGGKIGTKNLYKQ